MIRGGRNSATKHVADKSSGMARIIRITQILICPCWAWTCPTSHRNAAPFRSPVGQKTAIASSATSTRLRTDSHNRGVLMEIPANTTRGINMGNRLRVLTQNIRHIRMTIAKGNSRTRSRLSRRQTASTPAGKASSQKSPMEGISHRPGPDRLPGRSTLCETRRPRSAVS